MFDSGPLDDRAPKRETPRIEPVNASFECGCLASDVEWSKADWDPKVYVHHPRIVEGVRVCPNHGKPVAVEPG